MAHLDPYLDRKRQALTDRTTDWTAAPEKSVVRIAASSRLAGNTGARPTRVGEHMVLSDSAPGMAGHALGPTSPELMLGALASCLVHTYVIHACLLNIPLDSVEVEVSGTIDMAPVIGMNSTPPILADLAYRPHIASPAAPEAVERLHAAVDANCPVLNTLRMPMSVRQER